MTTRRIQSRRETYQLGHLRLYRDDLEQIAKAVAEVGDLTIRCGAWEMTDPADLGDNAELPERLPSLMMAAARPGTPEPPIKVILDAREALVQLTEPDTLTLGVLGRIQHVSQSGRRRRMRRPAILSALGATWGLAASVLILSSTDPSFTLLVAGLAFLGVFPISFVTALFVRTADSSALLINAYRADRPSFWQSTRNDWIVGTVMLLLGGVLGYLVNQIT